MKKIFISFIVATIILISFHTSNGMQRPAFTSCVQLLQANRLADLDAMLHAYPAPAQADHGGNTLLHIAAYYGYDHVIDWLVTQGIPLDSRTTRGDEALHIAARRHFEKTVAAFLACDANRNPTNARGETPLHAAITQSFFSEEDGKAANTIIKILLQSGTNPGIANSLGQTPLHYAVQFGHLELVKTLLSDKRIVADINKQCKSNKTPLDIALQKGFTEIARELLAHKAHISEQADDTIRASFHKLRQSMLPSIETLEKEFGRFGPLAALEDESSES